MSPENQQKLYTAFPQLYRGRFRPLCESLMSYGFCCGDGWFDLVWMLSEDIENLARAEGRHPDSDDWPEAVQVKQKFGSLRFHLRSNSDSEQMRTLLDKARNVSETICEECGKAGTLVKQDGIRTLCAVHARPGP